MEIFVPKMMWTTPGGMRASVNLGAYSTPELAKKSIETQDCKSINKMLCLGEHWWKSGDTDYVISRLVLDKIY